MKQTPAGRRKILHSQVAFMRMSVGRTCIRFGLQASVQIIGISRCMMGMVVALSREQSCQFLIE